MTIWGLAAGLALLVAVAAIAEALLRRRKHRPLARHAVTTRRWDDAAYGGPGDATIAATDRPAGRADPTKTRP